MPMALVPSPSDVKVVSWRVSRYAVQSYYHWMIAVLRAHAVVHELSPLSPLVSKGQGMSHQGPPKLHLLKLRREAMRAVRDPSSKISQGIWV